MITNKQQTEYDCETIAISYALSIDYDEVDNALNRMKWLMWLQNPIIGNPWNVKRALRKLNVEYENITVDEIKPEDTIIALIHYDTFPSFKHIFNQHWICKKPFELWNWGNGYYYKFRDRQLRNYTDCRLYRNILRVRKLC